MDCGAKGKEKEVKSRYIKFPTALPLFGVILREGSINDLVIVDAIVASTCRPIHRPRPSRMRRSRRKMPQG